LYPNAEFIATSYQEPPPDVTGRNVILVDFSYKRPILEEMHAKANTLRVYDHHKTAEEDLRGLDYCIFDMDRSGARLAWDYLYCSPFGGKEEAPWLVQYVEDRDLWRFKLPNSKEVNAALFSYQLNFELWDTLARRPLEDIITEGTAILRYQQKMVSSIVKNAIEVEIGGHKVLSVNSPVCQSEIGNKIAKGRPFGAVWYDDEEGRKYSLRSTENGLDVTEIAKKYGGGGHRSASGFKIKHGEML
jgi:oligoribonuclease NrnB/cAMP/cGMP phosphodiesterase (DHH superfamily)